VQLACHKRVPECEYVSLGRSDMSLTGFSFHLDEGTQMSFSIGSKRSCREVTGSPLGAAGN
jgi:hypothetical protein